MSIGWELFPNVSAIFLSVTHSHLSWCHRLFSFGKDVAAACVQVLLLAGTTISDAVYNSGKKDDGGGFGSAAF